MPTKETGKLGEDIAAKFLEEKGYKILEQNYRTRFSEIDLVCEKDKTLVFVETRTKIGEQFGSPEDTINKQKLLEAGSWAVAKEKGWVKNEGKEYIVQDGDTIIFKTAV